MPSGQVHSGITIGIATGGLISYIAYPYVEPMQMAMAIGGALFGLIVGCDMDVDGGNISNYYVRSFLGGFLGWIYSVWKLPYSLAMKHRSFWSHFPIVSTLIRLLYIFCPPVILIFRDQDTPLPKLTLYSFGALFLSLPYIFALGAAYAYEADFFAYLAPFIAGLMISDTAHYLSDELL